MPLNWTPARNFTVAGRCVTVAIQALHHDDGTPVINVIWRPSRPLRLSAEDIATFDREFGRAKRELLEAST